MKSGRHLLLAAIVAGIIFAVDITIPLGVAFGVLYIIVILITLQTPYRHAVTIAAVISTVLVLLGLVFSPEGGEEWKILFNRAIAIFSIWLITILGLVKKEKEELLHQSEAELREAQRTAKLGILRINFLDSSVWWSDDVYRCLGLKKDEFVPTYDMFFKYIHVDDVDRVREAIEKLRQSESAEAMEIEYRAVNRNGDELHIHAVFTPEKDTTGQTIRCRGVCQDITERKQAEEALQESQEIIEQNYHIQNVVSTILHYSLEPVTLKEILEYSLDTILSEPIFSLQKKGSIFLTGDGDEMLDLEVHHNLHASLQKACARVPFGRCLCGRAASTREIIFVSDVDDRHENNFDGMLPHGHYCVPILSGKRVLGVINAYVNAGHKRTSEEEEFLTMIADTLAGIIERKEAEEALIKNEEKLSKILNSIPDAVVISNPRDGLINYVNPAFTNISEYTSEEALGKTASELNFWVKPEEREVLIK